MTLLNEIQCDALKKLGVDNIKSLMDIIEILPEYIEEPEIGRFEYELIIRKNEICYESYDYISYLIKNIYFYIKDNNFIYN